MAGFFRPYYPSFGFRSIRAEDPLRRSNLDRKLSETGKWNASFTLELGQFFRKRPDGFRANITAG